MQGQLFTSQQGTDESDSATDGVSSERPSLLSAALPTTTDPFLFPGLSLLAWGNSK